MSERPDIKNQIEVLPSGINANILRQMLDKAVSGVRKEVADKSCAVLMGLITLPPTPTNARAINNLRDFLSDYEAFEVVELDLEQPEQEDGENYTQCPRERQEGDRGVYEGENCLTYPFHGVILRLDGPTTVSHVMDEAHFELEKGILLLGDYNQNGEPASIYVDTGLKDENGEPVTISAVPSDTLDGGKYDGKKRIAVKLEDKEPLAIFHSLIGDTVISSSAFETFTIHEGESKPIKLPSNNEQVSADKPDIADGGIPFDSSDYQDGNFFGATTPNPPPSCNYSEGPVDSENNQAPLGGAIIMGFAIFLRYNNKKRKKNSKQ